MLYCISNTVLNIVLLQHKKQLWFRKWSRLKCLDPSFPFSFIIALSIVTKNSSHDVINFTEESSVFLELFILHKTFIKCYQTTYKSSIIKSISIKIRMNLGTSYILWDYSSTVPCMRLQNTFSAILDPVASLGRLSIFEQRFWSVSQFLTIAKGLFPSWELHVMVCTGLTILPLCTSSAFPMLLSTSIFAEVWSVAQSWLTWPVKHCPCGWGSPCCCYSRALGPINSLGTAEQGPRKWPIAMNSDQ